MILYLDTSALLKLYVVEKGRDVVEQAVDEAAVIATSSVAYAEARASLARKQREGVFSDEELYEAVTAFEEDWQTFEKLTATENVARLAGNLAEKHALRGFDAIHLASALLVRVAAQEEAEESGEDSTRFLSFDGDLSQAASKTMLTYEAELETEPQEDEDRGGEDSTQDS